MTQPGWEGTEIDKTPSTISYKTWLWIGIVLSAVALFLPFESDKGGISFTWQKLLTGWVFVLTFETFVWLAAPLTLASWVCVGIRRPNAAMTLTAIALGVALPFIAGPTLTYGWGDHIYSRAQSPEIGYFLSVGAALATFVSAIQLKRVKSPAPVGRILLLYIVGIAILASIPSAIKFMKAEQVRRAVEERRLFGLDLEAQKLARRWTKMRPVGQALNEIPHAAAGVIPDALVVKRGRHEAELVNKLSEPIHVNVWVTRALPSGAKVICGYVPARDTRSNIYSDLVPVLAPREAITLRVSYPALEFYDLCIEKAGTAPLEFAVKSGDKTRILFLSDSAFEPAPPPRAEWIVEYNR